ncbi:MAG: sporulation integral membrane protein YtvI [Clostridia bacterium]|nr:sporulation integral membrane protein YtvI [Clostridia bacterium]
MDNELSGKRALERLCIYLAGSIAVLVLLWKFLPLIWHYLSPFIIALPLAAMIQPLIHVLERKCHLNRTFSVLIPVILLFLLLIIVLVWFASFGFNQIMYLVNHSGEIVQETSVAIRDGLTRLTERFHLLRPDETNLLQSLIDSLIAWLSQEFSSLARSVLGGTVNGAASIPFALVYADFFVLALYFIAKDYDRLLTGFHRGMFGNPDTSTGQITSSALVGFLGWLRMQSIYALLSLVCGSIYWSVLGYQYAILISFVAAFLEFLPIVGNGTIYIPWGIIAFLIGQPISGLEALGLFFGLLLIRRLTEPKLLSRSIGVPPLLSMIGMFFGLRLGGILGMVGGPVIATVAYTLWEGNYRKTIRNDMHVAALYLQERWKIIPMSENQDTDRPEPPPRRQDKRQGKGKKAD